MTAVTCKTCRYFDGDRCHRNAPIPTDVMQPLQTLWPRVAAGEWCGEHTTIAVTRRAPFYEYVRSFA